MLLYIYRVPYRKIRQYIKQVYNINVSVGTIVNIMRNLGTELNDYTENDILNKISKAEALHIDETSMRLNGKNVWVWGIHDPYSITTFYAIRHGRGSKQLRDIIPDAWNGVVICDGLRSYTIYPKRQRCWAHIIREIEHLAYQHTSSADVNHVLSSICDIRQTILNRHASGKHCSKNELRILQRVSYDKLKQLVAKYQDHDILAKFMRKLDAAGKSLFTFVVNPAISSTNNAAERTLREMVIRRKISGGIRSEDTIRWFPNIFSCVATWVGNQENIVEMLLKYV